MLSRFARMTAAVLSGVTASLLITATTAEASQQDRPVIVYAEPLEDVRTERVSYADLNLAVAKDEKRLIRRVSGAVDRVCAYDGSDIGVQELGYRRCADEAWDGARSQIARAVARAQEIAMTGNSTIAATAITIRTAAN